MKTWVSIEICGGLGNQLFQVGAALALAKQTGRLLKITKHQSSPSVTARRTYWNDFLKRFDQLYNNNNDVIQNDSSTIQWNEPGFLYSPLPTAFDASRYNIALSGYFQCENYIESVRSELLNSLIVEQETKGNSPSVDMDGCVVHVRRGDYLTHCNGEAHPVCSIDYYCMAIEEILRKRPNVVRWYLYSDDPVWLSKELIPIIKQKYATHETIMASSELADWQQLLEMSRIAPNYIIANSSFSWWAAWLSNIVPEQKVVVAPRKWFGPPNPSDWSTIYCKGWIVI